MKPGSRPGVAAALFLCLTAPPGGGCRVNPATGEKNLVLISREQEIAMGEQAAPEIVRQLGGLVDSQTLQQYVAEVGVRVARVAERDMPYQFGLLRSDVANALALPGGKVFVTAGLMRLLDDERQLAAVLGHEVGHVAALHTVQGLQRQLGAQLLADLAQIATTIAAGGAAGQAAGVGAELAAGLVNLRYSREDEYEADRLGIRYLAVAGYSPWGMVELLQRLQQAEGEQPGQVGELLQTHPLTDKRVQEARLEVQSAYPGISPTTGDPRAGRFREMRELLQREEGEPPGKR